MFKFKSKKSEWALSPEEKFKEMIKSLKKPGKKRRFSFEEAIVYLGNKKDKRATKPLIEVLKNSVGIFKSLAAEALGKIGDESAIEPLIQTLGKVNHAAEKTIKMIGEPAIKFLIQALNDEDESVYEEVRYILQDFGEPSVSPLLKALEDEHPQVRMQAVIALGYIGDKRAAEPLHQVMENDNDENVKEEAVFALGEMKDKRAVDMLIDFISDPYIARSQTRRCTAMKLLGEIRDTKAVEPLIEILEKWRGYLYQISAAEALGKIGDERAVLPLINWVKKKHEDDVEWSHKHPPDPMEDIGYDGVPLHERGEDPFYKMEPVKALIRIGKPAVEPLFQLLHVERLYWILKILYKIGQPAVKPMIHALKSPCAKTRDLAANVLSYNKWTEIEPFIQALHDEDEDFCKVIRNALEEDRAVEPLIDALRDESHHVRRNIVMILGRIRDKKASGPLMQMMLHDTKIEVRKEAVLALGHIRENSAVEPLLEKLSHNDKTMRELAAKALGEIGDERAIEPLIKVLKSGDVSLIAVTEDALAKIGKSTIKPLIQVLTKRDIEPYPALNALAKIGKSAIAPLFQLLSDQGIEGDILAALVKIGPPAVKPLIHAIKHESVDRELGYEAIVRIGEPAVKSLIQLLADKNDETYVSEVLVKVGKSAIVPLKNYLKTRSGSSDREKIEAIIGAISN